MILHKESNTVDGNFYLMERSSPAANNKTMPESFLAANKQLFFISRVVVGVKILASRYHFVLGQDSFNLEWAAYRRSKNLIL